MDIVREWFYEGLLVHNHLVFYPATWQMPVGPS